MPTHTTLTSLFSDIADEIRAKKGTSETIVADDFPDEIASIPSGGGMTAETAQSFREQHAKLFIDWVADFCKIDTKTALYTEGKTLYTPSEEYTTYAIFRRRNGEYQIKWSKDCFFIGDSSVSTFYFGGVKATYGQDLYLSTDVTSLTTGGFQVGLDTTRDCYYASGYSSIESAIEAILSPNTIYYRVNEYYFKSDDRSDINDWLTNSAIITANVNRITLTDTKRISTNETIEVIQ